MSLPDDGLNNPSIFQNINNKDPPGTNNDTSMNIFCEYGYQETLG